MVKAIRLVVYWTCILWVAGCAGEGNDPINTNFRGPSASGAAGAAGPVEEGAKAGAPCPGDNVTQPCTCTDGSGQTSAGRQTCNTSTGWDICQCAAVISGTSAPGIVGPLGNKSTVAFSWKETMPGVGTCKAGHYFGTFTGWYNSSAMGQNDQSMSPVGIPLVGTVEFDLHQTGNGEYFEIRDGAMIGDALIVFPFKGDISGTINCAGPEPHIECNLPNGSYLVGDTEYYFDGKAVGIYNKKDSAFISGEWAVTEPEDYSVVVRGVNGGPPDLSKATYAPLPPLVAGEAPFLDMFIEGGVGEWEATYQGPETGVGAGP